MANRFSGLFTAPEKPLKRFAAVRRRRHLAEYAFSAKGAVFILAWGGALGIVQRRDPSAEGASNSGASSITGAMPRIGCVESRFQRSFTIRSESRRGELA